MMGLCVKTSGVLKQSGSVESGSQHKRMAANNIAVQGLESFDQRCKHTSYEPKTSTLLRS